MEPGGSEVASSPLKRSGENSPQVVPQIYLS